MWQTWYDLRARSGGRIARPSSRKPPAGTRGPLDPYGCGSKTPYAVVVVEQDHYPLCLRGCDMTNAISSDDWLMGPSDDECEEKAQGGPFRRGGPVYAAKQWTGVIPLRKDEKLPAKKKITGRKGIQTEPEQYTRADVVREYGDCNLGLRLQGMVGIDVDDYESSGETKTGAADLAELVRVLGPLPKGPTSTARGDGPSRIHLFRLPEDFEVTEEFRGDLSPSIDVIQRHHRLVCAWPSVHPKTGSTYRWYDAEGDVMPEGTVPAPGDFPEIPAAWLEHLRKPQRQNGPGAGLDVDEFREQYTEESDPDLVQHILNKFVAREGSRHNTMMQALGWTTREAIYGKVAAGPLFDKLEDMWWAAKSGAAPNEFNDMLVKAVKEAPEPEEGKDDLYVDPDAVVEKPFAVGGWDFLAPGEPDEPPIWGDASKAALWNSGESLFIFGPPGAGKSTLAQLVVFARLGLQSEVLGFPVTDDGKKVLYLALDRPKQIQRAMRRLVRPEHEQTLRDRLLVRKGGLDTMITDIKNRNYIRDLCLKEGVGTVIVDSIKDVLPNASSEEPAAHYNLARQSCLAADVEWIELHHNRKANGDNKEPNTLEDVFGSRWITAGAGSVISLWQKDPTSDQVSMKHIRAAGEKLRPITLTIHGKTGTFEYENDHTMPEFLKEQGQDPFTAHQAAAYLKRSPGSVRITLNRMVEKGDLKKIEMDDESPFDDGSKSGYQVIHIGQHPGQHAV